MGQKSSIVSELRVIIAGSRDFDNYWLLSKEVSRVICSWLDAYGFAKKCECPEDRVRIISGHARGADEQGIRFAIESGFNLTIFPANWLRYKKSAGFIRNQTMADYAIEGDHIGCLIAFWDGKSKGTKHMIEIAENAGLDVYVCMF